MSERRLTLPLPHAAQNQVLRDHARFNVLIAGRRFGKSMLGIRLVADTLLEGKRVAWISPTYKMLSDIYRTTADLLAPVLVSRNASERRLEVFGGGVLDMWSLENPESIRGRHYRRMIVDEAALAKNTLADTWNLILRPTLIDDKGDAYFLTTPKGRGDLMTMYEMGRAPEHPDWASWHFTSMDNPYLPAGELDSMRASMPARAIEQEIEGRFIDEVLGALWTYKLIDATRWHGAAPDMARIVVAVDPAVSSNRDSDETGIVACGMGRDSHEGFVLADASGTYSPETWARRAVELYRSLEADKIVAEANQGGEMVQYTIRTIDRNVPVRLVHATRGKAIRAEPIVALYEQGRIHHVGLLPELETQMTMWSPVEDRESPDRVDAMVWGFSDLMLKAGLAWTPEQHAAYARGDDLYGPEWGDPEGWVPPGFTPPPAAGESAAPPKTAQERYEEEVAAQDAERIRQMVSRGW